jgi:hypothetical protein
MKWFPRRKIQRSTLRGRDDVFFMPEQLSK